MTINEILFSQNWILSLIFLLLIFISITSWYFIFYKIIFFRRENRQKNALNDCLEIINQEKNPERLEKKLNIKIEEIKDKYNFGNVFLATTANLTPFIGLFGTVLGVYFALMDISAQGNASISTVAKPIGEALIATAIGLWCAIPAAFAYNYFSKYSTYLVKKIKINIEKESL
jgi:biopolymer transport protein ExbB/TolQ